MSNDRPDNENRGRTAPVGINRSGIYRAMREGRFPEPLRVGPKSVRWRLSEVEAWIASLPRSHGDKAA